MSMFKERKLEYQLVRFLLVELWGRDLLKMIPIAIQILVVLFLAPFI